MTQASSLFQPPTTTMSLFFLSYFILFIFLNSWSVGRAPRCSLSPAYWKRRVILPPERSWNLLQPKPDGRVHGAVRHSCSPPYDVRKSGSRLSEGPPPPPPPPSPSSLPRLGLCFWVAPLPWHAKSPKKNRFFIFSQSNSCLVKSVLEMQIWRREHWVCEERSLKNLAEAERGLVPGANLFTVKFSRTRHMRTCDWTKAYIHTNGQKGPRRGCPDFKHLLIEV